MEDDSDFINTSGVVTFCFRGGKRSEEDEVKSGGKNGFYGLTF